MKNMKKKMRSKKRKTEKRTTKITKYQVKTFIFDLVKTIKRPEDIDEKMDKKVNEFLRTVNVKEEDNIIIDQGDGYIRVSIIYKVKIDKV